MTTIYDVARVAGVSTATVSRVLRGSDLVRAETRQRVLGVIEVLGFIPDASARGLSWGRKNIIALVGLHRGTDEIDVERSSLMFIDHIVHAAEQALRGTEYSLLLTFGTRGEQFEKRIRALAAKADGLLLAEGILDPQRAAVPDRAGARGRHRRKPRPGGGRCLPQRQRQRHDGAGRAPDRAAPVPQALLRRRPKDAPDAVARQAAFEQAVAATPDSVIDQVIYGDFSEDSGVAAARLLLGRTALPQAVACANDQMAIGAVRELQRAGVRVPAEVAVTGFDDLYPSRIIDPPLTTVSQPIHELGSRATHRLMARIASPGLAPRAEILPTRVVIRTSCGCPAPGGPERTGRHPK